MAQDSTKCVARSVLLDHLSTQCEEAPIAMGLTTGGKVLEVVVSATGSWTMIVTTPSGISCGVASGQGWERLEPPAGKKPNA